MAAEGVGSGRRALAGVFGAILALASLTATTASCGLSDHGSCDGGCADEGSRMDATLDVMSESALGDSQVGDSIVGDSSADGAEAGCTSSSQCPMGQACNVATGACSMSCAGGLMCHGGCCDPAGQSCVAGAGNDRCGNGGGACVLCTGDTPTCTNGSCTATCSPGTMCASGSCCSGSGCVPNSPTACGAGSSACTNCLGNAKGTACLATGVCGCTGAADCTGSPNGPSCVAGGVCGCTGASDCAAGFACQTATHLCVATCANAQCNGCCDSFNNCQAGNTPQNCGAVGSSCAPCNNDTVGTACRPGGTCGCSVRTDCGPNLTCAAGGGTCTDNCAGGLTCNGGCCSNPGHLCVTGTSDPANCGNGGGACAAPCAGTTPVCINGACGACSATNHCTTGCCNVDGSCPQGTMNNACGPTAGTCTNCTLLTTNKVCVSNACGCDGMNTNECNGGCCDTATTHACQSGTQPTTCGNGGNKCVNCTVNCGGQGQPGTACVTGGSCGCNGSSDCQSGCGQANFCGPDNNCH